LEACEVFFFVVIVVGRSLEYVVEVTIGLFNESVYFFDMLL
jgi:hypothetical protein